MTTITVHIDGIDQVINRITTVEQMRNMQMVFQAIGAHIKGQVNKYPPATEANSPHQFISGGNNTWYQRGYGPKWARKDGSVGGRKTSETLGRRWTVRAESNQVTIGNNVSYGPFVQDKENQASFHEDRGWKTIQDVAKDEEPIVKAFVEDYFEKLMK